MIDVMTIIILSLSLLYVIYVIVEHFYYKSKRDKIGLVIHVNGIRGKSTVTRLIDAGLRECGRKVVGKTTGTIPIVIDTLNKEVPIKRLGRANIREQLRVIDRAAKQGADTLVVECMAVNPELQYICEQRILHSNICVITNVRADHLDEMGEDLESIAYSLANTTPTNGTLVLGDGQFVDVFQKCADKKNATVVVAKAYDGEEMLDTFTENIAVALEVCDVLKLDRNVFFNGMRKYIHDPGALSYYKVKDTIFINGFSVNDPDSTLKVYEQIVKKYAAEDITIVLNERPDRPFRIEQHIDMISKMKFGKCINAGSGSAFVKKKLQDKGITAHAYEGLPSLLNEKIIFGCGNIAGDGMKIIEYFKTQGEIING